MSFQNAINDGKELLDGYDTAKSFLEQKNINTKYLHYRNSKYSLVEEKYLCDLFCVEIFCVKIVDNKVVEFYRHDYLDDDDKIWDGVSLDLNTEAPIDYYEKVFEDDAIMYKRYTNGNLSGITYLGEYTVSYGLPRELEKKNKHILRRCTAYYADSDGTPYNIIEVHKPNIPASVHPSKATLNERGKT